MTCIIFISYRKKDTGLEADRLSARLRESFGREAVFLDTDTLPAGVRYRDEIDRKLAECDVLLALIGHHWDGGRDKTGRRRIDDPEDLLRHEISRALSAGKRVIPVLVDVDSVPERNELPEVLRPLADIQWLELPRRGIEQARAELVEKVASALRDIRRQRENDPPGPIAATPVSARGEETPDFEARSAVKPPPATESGAKAGATPPDESAESALVARANLVAQTFEERREIGANIAELNERGASPPTAELEPEPEKPAPSPVAGPSASGREQGQAPAKDEASTPVMPRKPDGVTISPAKSPAPWVTELLRDRQDRRPRPAAVNTGLGRPLTDLAGKAKQPADAKPAADKATAAGAGKPLHVVESLDSLSVDIARAVDHDASVELWDRYRSGERDVFSRRLYTLKGQHTFDDIRRRYQDGRDFRTDVDRFCNEFEELLRDVARNDRDNIMTQPYLTSDTGKVYTMLAHVSGRLDTPGSASWRSAQADDTATPPDARSEATGKGGVLPKAPPAEQNQPAPHHKNDSLEDELNEMLKAQGSGSVDRPAAPRAPETPSAASEPDLKRGRDMLVRALQEDWERLSRAKGLGATALTGKPPAPPPGATSATPEAVNKGEEPPKTPPAGPGQPATHREKASLQDEMNELLASLASNVRPSPSTAPAPKSPPPPTTKTLAAKTGMHDAKPAPAKAAVAGAASLPPAAAAKPPVAPAASAAAGPVKVQARQPARGIPPKDVPGRAIAAPRRSLSRRLFLGGAGAAAAATAWFTRDSWLPAESSEPTVRTIKSAYTLAGNGTRLLAADIDVGGMSVTADAIGAATIWSIANGGLIYRLAGHSAAIGRAAFSHAGPAGRLLTASADGTARIWAGQGFQTVTLLDGHAGPVTAATWLRDGSRVATGAGAELRLWDGLTGELLWRQERHAGPITHIASSPGSNYVATASEDRTARVWLISNSSTSATLAGSTKALSFVTFSPDGGSLATASLDGVARQWRPWWESAPQELRHANVVHSVQYSPDGLRLITASMDRTAGLWDAGTGASIASLRGHADGVVSARFSADGRLAVTASFDNTARIWNGATGAPLAVLEGHGRALGGAMFSPDGTAVLTWSDDATARIWPVPSDLLSA